MAVILSRPQWEGTHTVSICVNPLDRRQAIIWTNADLLIMGLLLQ